MNAQHQRPSRPLWSLCLLCLSALLFAGCTVGPDYRVQTPTLDATVPAAWHTPLAVDPVADRIASVSRWWERFNDPVMSGLIEASQQNNPTLDQALARLTQARANAAQHRAQQLPTLDARGTTTRSQTNSQGWSGLESIANGELDASWEIDLFGKVRRGVEGAQARVESRQAEWYDARVTLAADVADVYVQRRACERTVQLDQHALDSQRATERLTDQKTQAGFTATSDLARAEAGTAQAAATLDQQQGRCEQQVNRLVLLTGLPVDEVVQRLSHESGEPAGVPRAQVGIPDEVPAHALTQRPDVAAKERSVAAASADVGVTQADRYPSFSVAGMIGINRSKYSGISSHGPTWSIGPTLDLPIFDAGQRKAAVEQAQGAYDEAAAAYRATVRQAVSEVEDALVRLHTVDAQERNAQRAAERYATAFTLINQGYAAGFNSLLDLEDSRRTWLSAQATVIDVGQERAQATIALYKALGGGWPTETSDDAARPVAVTSRRSVIF